MRVPRKTARTGISRVSIMNLRSLFDPASSTFSYLLFDPVTREAVMIDPVRDQLSRDSALIHELGLTLRYVIETHLRADELSGATWLGKGLGAKRVLSRRIAVSGLDPAVDDGDWIHFGRCSLEVRATPGHTLGCLSFVSADRSMVFTGDALLIRSTGRTDLHDSDAETLYASIQDRIFSLPNSTRVYPGHDYRGFCMTTVGEEKLLNPRLACKTQSEFVVFMEELACKEAVRRDGHAPRGCCGADPFALATGELISNLA